MKNISDKKSAFSGDKLLAQDTLLYEPLSSIDINTYVAYPSRSISRFIVPLDDKAARLFLIRLLSTDRGLLGVLLRLVAKVPIVSYFLVKTFAEQMPVSTGKGVSIVEKIRQCVHNNREVLPRRPGTLSVTKFCQRIVGLDTKILFLVSDEYGLLCILKTMRTSQYDGILKREKEALDTLAASGIRNVPRVYFEGSIDGRYIYAEEVINGIPISKSAARAKVREIIELIAAFPIKGSVSSDQVEAILREHGPQNDINFNAALMRLRDRKVSLKTGVTHSDLGRVNILLSGNNPYIIDWGRVSECPFYLIDAVYFLVRIWDIKHADDWCEKGAPRLVEYTGIDRQRAEALYDILIATEILHKKYIPLYQSVISDFGKLI